MWYRLKVNSVEIPVPKPVAISNEVPEPDTVSNEVPDFVPVPEPFAVSIKVPYFAPVLNPVVISTTYTHVPFKVDSDSDSPNFTKAVI